MSLKNRIIGHINKHILRNKYGPIQSLLRVGLWNVLWLNENGWNIFDSLISILYCTEKTVMHMV